MPRRLRIEYPGAVYHVIKRGDHLLQSKEKSANIEDRHLHDTCKERLIMLLILGIGQMGDLSRFRPGMLRHKEMALLESISERLVIHL
jgi:hypothetical protein